MNENGWSAPDRSSTAVPHSEASSETAIALRTSQIAASMPESAGQEVVELVAEDERGPVGDLGLHRDDRRQALAHEGLADAGERVASGRPRALARVEDGELHGPGVVEQRPEPRARDPVRRAVVALEDEDALLRLLVEAAVADEVEDVEVVEQGALQARQGRVLEDRDAEAAARDEVAGRRREQLLARGRRRARACRSGSRS